MGASAPWRPQAATANPPHAGHKQAASFPPPLASSSPLIEAAASRGVSFFIAAASLPGKTTLFHDVKMDHISTTWDVTAEVFWKGEIREYRGARYLRIILRDEGTKMKAVAHGNSCVLINNTLSKEY
ncbi:hypothetical protein U9M48_040237 [Paspalum notatum var. saurae]|uniref:Uncharacterized protein n=1 Tax=Paspalum notatum var. saurae TaxID=547442 RepID=A0AAQ3ULB5_PASNO